MDHTMPAVEKAMKEHPEIFEEDYQFYPKNIFKKDINEFKFKIRVI